MKNTISEYQNKKEFHQYVSDTYTELARLKKEDDREEFNALLLTIMPEVKRYITKQLNTAMAKGLISKNKFDSEGVKNQLFLEVYDHFDEIEDKENLHPWLFKKADELLDYIFTNEEFDDFFLKNIDVYSKPEWDAMEEKFSTDGDGDLVMLEELDDISYRKNDYVLNHVFIEDGKQEIASKLDKQLNKETAQKHRDMVLRHFPKPMREVFELATEHQFNVEDIARIRNQNLTKVQQLLEDARKSLEASFFSRYLVDRE